MDRPVSPHDGPLGDHRAGPDQATFGALLRRHRAAAGLTLEILAERAAMSVRALIYLEGEIHHPYAATVQRLADALALPPVDRTAFLVAARLARAASRTPTTDAARRVTASLPRPATPLIGRQDAVAAVVPMLEAARLLTLTGAGGVGKTRLAIEVAARAAHTYPDGVVFVDIAPLADPALVPSTLAAALGLQSSGSRPLLHRLADTLRTRRMLLVLDNCEHLVDACAPLAGHLLRACPDLQMLATSRGALAVDGEMLWRVPSLALPPAGGVAPAEVVARSAAVRLFVERATALHATFRLTAANAPAIVAICRRLDGIPLALELAAARTRLLSPAQIAARLDDRFGLLTAGSRTALPRHQTLRAVVDWSHELLAPAERILLRRLAVFAGGWTLTAAETVCTDASVPAGAVVDLLAGLVNQSLVMIDERGGEGGQEMRYQFLETIRQYAADRLDLVDERETLRRAHGHWALALAVAAGGAGGAHLDEDYDNLRAALAWSLEQDDGGATALRLATELGEVWAGYRHRPEGRAWLERILTRAAPVATPERAEALVAAGVLAWADADRAAARAWYHAALDAWHALGDVDGERRVLVLLGLPGMDRAQQEVAYGLVAAAVTTSGPLPTWLAGLWFGHRRVRPPAADETVPYLERRVEILITLAQMTRGDDGAARTWLERTVAMLRPHGPSGWLVRTLCELAATHGALGDWASADACWAEARALIPRITQPHQYTRALHDLAWTAWLHGDVTTAGALWEEHLTEALRQDAALDQLMWPLMHLGDVAWAQGALDAARERYTESLGLAQTLGLPLGLTSLLHRLGRLALAEGDLARAAHLAQRSLDYAREIDAGWHEANALALHGDIALARGDLDGAGETYRQSLQHVLAYNDGDGQGEIGLRCLDGLAAVAARSSGLSPIALTPGEQASPPGQAQLAEPGDAAVTRAMRLYAASNALRARRRTPRAPADEAVHGPIIAALRAVTAGTATETTGTTGQTVIVEQVVADALK